MKKTTLTLLLVMAGTLVQAQILTPVKWAYAAKKISKTEAVVMIRATVEDGWHIYSQNLGEGGPVKTTFTFAADKKYQLTGKTMEPMPVSKYEKAFGMNVSFFAHAVVFQQKIRLNSAGPITVKGSVEYMTCNDEKCLPPDQVDFTVTIP